MKKQAEDVAPAHVMAMLEIRTTPCRVRGYEPPGIGRINLCVVQDLIGWGLVFPLSPSSEVFLRVTERGEKWVEMIIATPLPVSGWLDPR